MAKVPPYPARALALRDRARKLLRAAARAVPTGVMATPPTVTLGAAGAASTLTTGYGNSGTASSGGQSHPGNSGLLSDLSGVWGPSTLGSGGYAPNHVTSGQGQASNGYRVGAKGAGKGFFFDGQVFEVCVDGAMTAVRFAATDLATGLRQWVQAADHVPATGGNSHVKVDLGSRANRIVECFFASSANWPRLFGFNFMRTDTVLPLPSFADDPRMAVLGDSYVAGASPDHIRAIAAYVCAETLGVRNPILNGVGGTGYLNNNATAKTFGERIAAGDFDVARIGAMDLVAMIGSVNDALSVNAAYTDAAYQAAVTNAVGAAMTAQPGAIILVSGPQFTRNFQTGASRYAACAAGVAAAVSAAGETSGRVRYLDTSPTAGLDAWQTGTGTTAATVGDGSNDFFGAADGVHPNALGNANYGRRMALGYVRALQILAT